jgi:DNA-binding transcriptional LysR family regulator/transcription elongation GreA/GreB family factor
MRAGPDDILGMAYFARVVEARSFSDAARSLKVSKSAVSARVARLEARLGLQLLHRTTRRLALTADGVRVYEKCARVVAEADAAADIAAGASALPRGTLRIHAPSGFVESHLLRPIADFMRAHPSVRVELRLSDAVPDLTVDPVDLAIVIVPRLADSGLTTRKLASIRVAVCAAPAYLRRKGIPFRPQDLVLHDCVAHAVRLGNDDLRFETDEGSVSMASLARLVTDDARFLREAALAGLGVVMVPEIFVTDDLAAGRLHRVLDEFPTTELVVHALHPHGRLAPASVRAFLDHLGALGRELPNPRSASRTTQSPRRRKGRTIAMTEQDVRRLSAVAALYVDVDPGGASELRELAEHAKTLPVAKMPRRTVTIHSRVRVRQGADDGEREITLVYPWDANGGDRVSVMTAFGRGLLGAEVGSALRDGDRVVTVAAVPYQPEAAGDHHL